MSTIHMNGIKTIGDIQEYEYNADFEKLDDYNSKVLKVYRLIYKQLPANIRNKLIFDNLPVSNTICYDYIKQIRMENLHKYSGLTFTSFGNNFITDTGKGGFYIGTSCSYTLDDSHEFNKNMEKANFAKLKQKQSKNYSNNTYYTEYFWHVNNDVIKPLEGFYKSSSVKESWKKICFNNGIVDGDSYKKFLEN